jgi:hypothetical protein
MKTKADRKCGLVGTSPHVISMIPTLNVTYRTMMRHPILAPQFIVRRRVGPTGPNIAHVVFHQGSAPVEERKAAA